MASRQQSCGICLVGHVLAALLLTSCLAQQPGRPSLVVTMVQDLGVIVEGQNSTGISLGCVEISPVTDQLELRWLRNGMDLPLDRQTIQSGTVLLTRLDLTGTGEFLEADSGRYECRARNTETNESATSDLFDLTVNVRAQILQLQGQEVQTNRNINLTCSARGTTPITYTWLMDGTVLQNEISSDLQNRFSIADAKRNDTGNYSCQVLNNFGNQMQTAVLNVIEAPDLGPAYAPRVVAGQLKAITIEWDPADFAFIGNTPITAYAAECVRAGTGTTPIRSSTLPPTQRSATIPGLAPGQLYSCFLTVTNKVGATASQSNSAAVREEAPSEAPMISSATATSSTSIQVQWEAINAASYNGVLRGYRVEVTARNCTSCPCRAYSCQTEGTFPTLPSVLSNTAIGLRKFTEYDVTVVAFNNAGSSVPSSPMRVMTKADLPDMPTNIKAEPAHGASGLMLTYTPPEEPNGVITRYDITYESLDPSFTVARETLPNRMGIDQAVVETIVNGLRRKTRYNFTIAGVNSIGVGLPGRVIGTTEAFPLITTTAAAIAVSKNAETVVLQCRVEADPTSSIFWNHPGNATRVPANADGSLTITKVQESDAGIYICTATNIWGTATTNVTVEVTPEESYIISGFKDTYLFICIGGAVLLIMILVTICILCCRRHNRGSSSKTSTFYARNRYGGGGAAVCSNNPNFDDPASEPGSPQYCHRYGGNSAGATGTATSGISTVGHSHDHRTPGVGGPQSSDSFDKQFNQTAATFQQQNNQQFRQTVTPLATLNNQPHHQYQPSNLSTGSSLAQPPSYTDENLLFAAGGGGGAGQYVNGRAADPNLRQATHLKTISSSTDRLAANEQLPTYTARHGDHILTAM